MHKATEIPIALLGTHKLAPVPRITQRDRNEWLSRSGSSEQHHRFEQVM